MLAQVQKLLFAIFKALLFRYTLIDRSKNGKNHFNLSAEIKMEKLFYKTNFSLYFLTLKQCSSSCHIITLDNFHKKNFPWTKSNFKKNFPYFFSRCCLTRFLLEFLRHSLLHNHQWEKNWRFLVHTEFKIKRTIDI